MIRRLNRSIMMLGSLAVLVTGCGANPTATGQVDAYGNPIVADPYGTGAYDAGSDYGTTGDAYGDTSGGSYDNTPSTGSDYGDTTGGTSTTYGASPSPSPTPSQAATGNLDDRPVLVATIMEVKETGVMGMGKIIAEVEVENPGNVTLSGKLRVMFTDNGDPTANAIIRRVTLKPKERQSFTFTAKAWRLDDAEASVETDELKTSRSDALN